MRSGWTGLTRGTRWVSWSYKMTMPMSDTFRDDVKTYVAEDRVTKLEMRKLLTAHSDEIWGTGDGNPGLKVKLSTLHRDVEDIQKIIDSATRYRIFVVTTMLGLILERVWGHFFPH